MGVTSPGTGVVRLPGSVSFLHRGIGLYTTAQEDFGTSASKTYHLRWDFATDDYLLEDLSDSGYNPSSAAETSTAFDSTYDDMLIARVVTNSSNVVTVTDLVNKARLFHHESVVGINWRDSGANGSVADFTYSYNWCRSPVTRSFSTVIRGNLGVSPDQDQAIYTYGEGPGISTGLVDFPVNRYSSKFAYMWDYSTSLRMTGDFQS